MPTQCIQAELDLGRSGGRKLVGAFDGGAIASTSPPGATGPDYNYSRTIEETADRYARAGHPRTTRTLQRYGLSGHLDCQKVATALGDKSYLHCRI